MPSVMAQQDGADSQLLIKVALGDDVRKVVIHNLDVTRDELLVMMQRIFKGRLSPADNITLKYRDEDDDLVTVGDDTDLALAIQQQPVLKLTLLVNDKVKALESDDLKRVKGELRFIRDRTTHLLDSLELAVVPSRESAEATDSIRHQQHVERRATADDTSEEFDPLGHRNLSAEAAAGDALPPATPDGHGTPHEKPPSVYGVGQYPTYDGSRPDTPGSMDARRAAAAVEPQTQENVATIQPTVHQQINAGQPNQPTMLNGPPTYATAPAVSAAPPPPPPPPPTANQMYAYSAQQPQQPNAPPAVPNYGGPPPSAAALHQPPTSGMPAYGQPQQQHGMGAAHPPPPQQHAPPPTNAMQMHGGSQMGQQMQMPPQQQQQQQYGGAYPPPPTQPPTSAYQMSAPPAGGLVAGANPFARGVYASSAYVRPQFPHGTYQQQQ